MINRMIEYDKQNSTSVLKYTKKLFISSGILHYDVHTAGGYSGGVLKAATCLWILLFLNNRFVVHFCMCQQFSFICTSVLKYIKKKKVFFVFREHTFMMYTWQEVGGVLKFVTCLWVLLLLNNRSIVHFCRWREVRGRG